MFGPCAPGGTFASFSSLFGLASRAEMKVQVRCVACFGRASLGGFRCRHLSEHGWPLLCVLSLAGAGLQEHEKRSPEGPVELHQRPGRL